MSRHFDIIVVGAGMVGACVALSLSRQGFRVALIEPAGLVQKSRGTEAEYDLRVSALSPTSEQILSQLGVWGQLDQQRLCHYEKMFIWHQSGTAAIQFDSTDLAREHLGTIVENRQILRALHSACEAEQNIDSLLASLESLTENSDQQLGVQLSSGEYCTADLLIAADGRDSATRELAGFEVTWGDYQQQAIVANICTEHSHQLTAWQRFLRTGPLAFLPLANGQTSIVWSCDNMLAEQMMAVDDRHFGLALSEAIEHRFGKIQILSQRRCFALRWHRCRRWLKNRVLLIGDAAHGVHPLAGQGVNLGFSDVNLLTQRIGSSDCAWHPQSLRRFERQRNSETALATFAFSGLKWMYGADHWLLGQMRDLGMQLIENHPAARRWLMQQALRNMA